MDVDKDDKDLRGARGATGVNDGMAGTKVTGAETKIYHHSSPMNPVAEPMRARRGPATMTEMRAMSQRRRSHGASALPDMPVLVGILPMRMRNG